MDSEISISIVSSIETYIKEGIWKLLCQIDEEFIPPLSSRTNTTQSVFHLVTKNSEKNGLENYFSEILKQKIILAHIKNKVVGFISFINNYSCQYLPDGYTYNYITTIGVIPEFRRRQIAMNLYSFMIKSLPYNIECDCIATRTWSNNFLHINLLKKLNFKLVYTIEDGRSKGIDTVYYARKGDII